MVCENELVSSKMVGIRNLRASLNLLENRKTSWRVV